MVNKSVFLSLLVIGVVAAAAGAGTWASFSDVEKSTANTLTAGTLDLQLSSNGEAFSNGLSDLSVQDVYPGASGTVAEITVKNAGTIDGNLSLVIPTASLSSTENGVTDAESKLSPADTEPAGELIPEVTFTVNGASYIPGTILDLSSLADGATQVVTVGYLVDSDAGNNIQSDTLSFDIEFDLVQSDIQTV